MKQVQKKLPTQRLKLIENSLKIYCYHCGSKNYKKNGFKRGKQEYRCNDCKRYFKDSIDINSRCLKDLPLGDDVWDANNLGLRVTEYTGQRKLIFLYIEQEWLKEVAKKFIKYKANNRQLTTLQSYICSLNKFSEFISLKHPYLSWETLNRNVILDYLDYLKSQSLGYTTKIDKIGTLKQLFEIGNINSWFSVPSYLIRQEDYPKPTKTLPRYIPETVMTQLNQHIDKLPEPVMRMILVLQEAGLRIGELLLLPLDCLKQDTIGDWFLYHTNWKFNKEDTKPISTELAKVIQEQQRYIKNNLPNYSYLFCARTSQSDKFVPKPNVMGKKSFINFLKRLAKEHNICDDMGKIWNFQTHQFRHTVATRMINSDVPHHIVQRYLGHETPTMTSVYAHIHDQTLKKEIAKYHDSRVVNVAGEVVESISPELDNNLDLHLLKKKVLAQSLPNGSCARPIVLGECPHANACFTCGDFRTTIDFLEQHKAQLEETEKLVKNAEEKGWKRHAEMNTKVRDNLQKIITTLESGNKSIVSGGDE